MTIEQILNENISLADKAKEIHNRHKLLWTREDGLTQIRCYNSEEARNILVRKHKGVVAYIKVAGHTIWK